MHKRMITALLLLCVFCIFVCGCQKQQVNEETLESSNKESIQIGLSFDSFVIERWLRDRDVFISTAQGLGAEVNFQNANGDIEEQISQIEYFIKKKMDAIVIIAIDGAALNDVVKKAKDEGIKVICYDRIIRNADTDLYISFDNEQVGVLMAEAIKESLPKGGDIFIINGSDKDYNVTLVNEGIQKVLKDTDISVKYTAYCDNWLAELALTAVEEGLRQCETVDGIIFGNDDLAGQGVRALAEHRLAGKTIVVAQDAELSACQRIAERTQKMTVYKSVDELAKKAAVLTVALVNGTDITKDSGEEAGICAEEYIDDGTYKVPYVKVQPVAVTSENLDQEIIESGFHAYEDVYLNVK
ncbi:MAG: substrate-binding domain-containing protein [Blautia sp.]|nr:substrate-binding domain-containing protein [Blautia sp.]